MRRMIVALLNGVLIERLVWTMKCGRNDPNLDSTRFSGSSETAY